MPAELTPEAEGLLLDLANAEADIARHRGRLDKRQLEIANVLVREIERAPASERVALKAAAPARISELRRTVYRSELAHLAAEIVTAERRRARILRALDAFPQFGESVPAVDLAVEHDGERGFVIRTGGGRVFRFSLPIMLDRGVWRADGNYRRGDCTTHGGQIWIAQQDGAEHEPGMGGGWRLAVSRGKPGRDAPGFREKRNQT